MIICCLLIQYCFEAAGDEWSKEANAIVNSFFDTFYELYRDKEGMKKKVLLSHASKQNGTRLGYGHGNNGKGNTAEGLLDVFVPLEQLIKEIITIEKAEDLPVLIPYFAEDGLSDLLTKVLHGHLNKFTSLQMATYGIKSNSLLAFSTWDRRKKCWKKIECYSYCVEGQELLVVPKHIVRKKSVQY